MDLSPYRKTKGISRKIMKFHRDILNVDLEHLTGEGGLRFPLSLIEEIIDVRNGIQHENRFWDLSCQHGTGFIREFGGSVFSGEPVMEISVEGNHHPDPATTEILVTSEAVAESGARIQRFAECLERRNPTT